MQDHSQLKIKQKETQNLKDLLVKLEEKSKKDSDVLQAAQDHFQAVSAGLSSSDGGEDKTLADQVMTCKSDISAAETEVKQAQMK